ncbi:1186_t:CDS:1, partial [Racocetra persica]
DPIFQDREIVQFELSTDIADSNIKGDTNMDFDPEDLVDTVLSVKLALEIK